MKKASDIFRQFNTINYPDCYKLEDVLNAIKFAQEDAIRKTVKECAENADAGCDFGSMSMKRGDLYATFAGHIGKVIINKQSILSVADKLIKEL